MIIENIEQLKQYVHSLPWYKRIFFPQVMWTRLNNTNVIAQDIREIYNSEILTSWFSLFYTWLFPEVALFANPTEETTDQIPTVCIDLPTNYEQDIKKAIRDKSKETLDQLAKFLSTHQCPDDMLSRILAASIYNDYYGAEVLLSHNAYSSEVVSRIFMKAIKKYPVIDMNIQWFGWGIDVINKFIAYPRLSRKLDNESINAVILLNALEYKQITSSPESSTLARRIEIEENFKQLLYCEQIKPAITLQTIYNFLQQVIVPIKDEPSDIEFLRCAINFEDNEGETLSTECLREIYLQTIEHGRVNVLAMFSEPIVPYEDDSMIESLKKAAECGHYVMIVHCINNIPEQHRFDVLQTKSVAQNHQPERLHKEPDSTHVLQWAACRTNNEYMKKILYSLEHNTEERYKLITDKKYDEDHSSLFLASVNLQTKNLLMMLNSMSYEQMIEALLPKRLTLFTPFNSRLATTPETHERSVVPLLLAKIFKNDKKKYDPCKFAQKFILTGEDLKTLREYRDYYLDTYYPRAARSFFSNFFGLRASKKPCESKLQLKVVMHRNYHVLDDGSKPRIHVVEERMDRDKEVDQSVENRDPNNQLKHRRSI